MWYSHGCIFLAGIANPPHISQQWPHSTDQVQFDPITIRIMALSEVECRQQYLNKVRGEAEQLKLQVEDCLDNNPTVRRPLQLFVRGSERAA